MENLIKKAANTIANAQNIAALTGAGISVESGIPPFRGQGGVWERIDPMEYAHIDALIQNPVKVWNMLIKEMASMVGVAQPNDGHKGLVRLERQGCLKTIITQNVDGLHQKAGSTDVIEFHGSFAWLRCMQCNKRCETGTADLSVIPPRCECGGIFRPDCIFFGEIIPPDVLMRSHQVSSECELMLVIGTSATVQPAASIPMTAKAATGAVIIEINPEPTPLTEQDSDIFLQGKAGDMMNRIGKFMPSSFGFEI
ncbi:NAD-dependent deacylase [Desulfococcaceae bacterium HSG7]|nr:NAD-dependent deacylase [Desulfococcaceae bacterium HSG9]MDM8554151.1 NAD-dependent deacylase [Desulfococcaceae bacterium HSG7]